MVTSCAYGRSRAKTSQSESTRRSPSVPPRQRDRDMGVRERWEGGENVAEIAKDFALGRCHVVAALKFEAVNVDIDRPSLWQH